MRSLAAAVVLTLAATGDALAQPSSAAPGSCERLASLTLSDTTIRLAQTVAAGAFQPPTGGGAPAAVQADVYRTLPPFCRVTANVSRRGDTPVGIEVWLPLANWNGEFRPAASGFAGGAVTYAGMADVLKQGWATANTNRGHDAGVEWKLSDMTGVPVHLMTVTGKALITAFYQRAPSLTLMNECGGGGSRDALQLVQQFPEDLDAAAAVGFVYDATHHGIGQMWVYQATHKTPAHYVPPSKYALINRAVLAACDGKDGLVDGVIADPPRCGFDASTLACKASRPGGTAVDRADCLTAPQIEAVKQIYSPAVHARTGKYLFAPMVPGGELMWEPMAGPTPYPYTEGFYRNAVFHDQGWDITRGIPNFDTHVDLAEAPANEAINATGGDLSRFIGRGGKLLLIGGWNDHTLAPGSFVDYYESVVKTTSLERARDSVRLFMVPGMDHCLGSTTYGPLHTMDVAGELRRWKASGKAPDTLVVTTHKADGTEDLRRPVCAYPQVPRYRGQGSPADPANFACVAPEASPRSAVW